MRHDKSEDAKMHCRLEAFVSGSLSPLLTFSDLECQTHYFSHIPWLEYCLDQAHTPDQSLLSEPRFSALVRNGCNAHPSTGEVDARTLKVTFDLFELKTGRVM